MKFISCLFSAVAILGACAPQPSVSVAMACSETIGKPISERIAALGPPASVVRISPTQVGYKFVAKATSYDGGEFYYTINYMHGSDLNQAPIYATTGVCTGTFIVNASTDATPLSRRIVVSVRP
ncbi:hypothetical protein AB4072_06440 [Microvirga sp. 2MCAF38]|uniref:hypothetical protein n=1 Tax=Microvirga sp. 2MCAF38 TaxID=3232989 RepID=UPI003F9A2A7D